MIWGALKVDPNSLGFPGTRHFYGAEGLSKGHLLSRGRLVGGGSFTRDGVRCCASGGSKMVRHWSERISSVRDREGAV